MIFSDHDSRIAEDRLGSSSGHLQKKSQIVKLQRL